MQLHKASLGEVACFQKLKIGSLLPQTSDKKQHSTQRTHVGDGANLPLTLSSASPCFSQFHFLIDALGTFATPDKSLSR